DRMTEDRLSDLQDALQVPGADRRLGDRDRGLQHRQGHALCAVAEDGQVAAFHRIEAIVNVVQIDVAGDDPFEFGLRGAVVVLAAPQRVVGVETDQADAVFWHPPSLSPDRDDFLKPLTASSGWPAGWPGGPCTRRRSAS